MSLDKEVKRLFIEGEGKMGMVESNKPGSDWYISHVGEKTRLKKLRELEIEREKCFEYVNSKLLNANYRGK